MSRKLAELFPDAYCELDFTTPLELLVATVLSAQTTDVRVNMVTPALFARYRSAADYAGAKQADVEELIRTIGLFRAKAAHLIGIGAALCDRFGGEVPRTLRELVSLPGVGRKTANVVLGNAFGVPGLTVDTHFSRLVGRWGWTEETDPTKIEFAVGALIERKDWTVFSHRVIWFGRSVCHARRPACGACPLAVDCPSYGIGPTEHVIAERLVKTSYSKEFQ